MAFSENGPDKQTASLIGAGQVKLIAYNNCLASNVCYHNHS